MEISFLIGGSCLEGQEELLDDIPFKYLADIGEVHLDAVLILVSAQFHLRELSSLIQFVDGWKMVIRHEDNPNKRGILERSRGRTPIGVAYSMHLDSAHPSRGT
jgi:hypothetical protein